MSYSVEVLADSISPDGARLITLQTKYPRFIHSEMLRHRVFSHSVASSRAIPPEKLIEQVQDDPFVPETFNKRVKGMGVGDAFSDREQQAARAVWENAAEYAARYAEQLLDIDVDKSRVNRLLEPFMWVTDIISATEWDNFFALRDHSAAQPEFQILAKMMREAIDQSNPSTIDYGQWHLPLDSGFPYEDSDIDWDRWAKICAGRCARVSYDTHEQFEPTERSHDRAEKLIASGHLSPFEHCARPVDDHGIAGEQDYGRWAAEWTDFVGNLRGWVSFRKTITHEDNFGALMREAT